MAQLDTLEQQYVDNPYGIAQADEVKPEPRKPDAHICTVNAVTYARSANADIPMLRVNMITQTGITMDQAVFLTEGIVENFDFSGRNLDVESRIQFGRSIHNSENRATFDRYLSAAKEQGKTDYSELRASNSVESFAEALTNILSGVEVLVLRKPSKQGFLNVTSVDSLSKLQDAKFLQRLDKGGYNVTGLE